MKNEGSEGAQFLGLLTILFITLKLLGKISWSWTWVLSPLWAPLLIALCGGSKGLVGRLCSSQSRTPPHTHPTPSPHLEVEQLCLLCPQQLDVRILRGILHRGMRGPANLGGWGEASKRYETPTHLLLKELVHDEPLRSANKAPVQGKLQARQVELLAITVNARCRRVACLGARARERRWRRHSAGNAGVGLL